LPEIAGDAALYADARDPLQFGAALHRAFTDMDLLRSMVVKGKANVQRFNWRSTALQTLEIYQRIIGAPCAGSSVSSSEHPALASSRDSGGVG